MPPTVSSRYLVFDNVGNLWITIENAGLIVFNENGIVPVEFISFTSDFTDSNVTIKWQTATETNNAGFEIYRNTPLIRLSRGEAEGRGV